MFEEFYHLTQNPFQINTDPRFLWLGEKHKEALAILQYGLLGNKSFLLLTGDVGTGKTTLINALLNGQGDDTLIASIQDPDLSTLDLYNYIAYAFGIPDRFDTKGKFLASFRKFLTKNYYNGKRVLLVIDEAQRTKQEILEDIRGLSNIEVDGNKLINIFFVGQNEFNDMLLQDENKAIRQRITISYNLKPLSCDEVGKYIQYRLFKAGAKGRIFKKDAVKEIFEFTDGYPRLINILCDRCLLTGFVLGKKIIGRKIVKECCAEIDMSMPSKTTRQDIRQEYGHRDHSLSTRPGPPWRRVCLACFFMILLGSVWFSYDKITNMFFQHFSGEGRIQEGGAIESASPVLPTDHTSVNPGSKKETLKGRTRIVPDAVGHKENQATLDVLSPPPFSGKGKKTTFSKGGETRSIVKTGMSQASHYERKMQILFQSDSISPAPEYIEALKIFSDRFIELGAGQIVIRGYTDRSGTVRYNKKLAKFRADSIKTFLEGRGVDKSKIITVGVISDPSSDKKSSLSSTMKTSRRVELEIVLPGSSN